MIRAAWIAVLAVAVFAPLCAADAETPLKDLKAKESYSLGYEFGARIKRQDVPIDREVLMSAVVDGLTGKDPAVTPQEMNEILRALRKKVMILANKRVEESAAQNIEKGKAFLEENKKKEGVVTLPSGLQYRVIKEGSGEIPKENDEVTVAYRGTLVDGTEFDNSRKKGEPATVKVKGVIKGWTEALRLMKTGSTWQLFIPENLAYGRRQFGRIPPNSTLIFELELLSIVGGPKAGTAAPSPGRK